MSIESNKLMNLADGKVLYDDLRGLAESVVEVSTTEPTSENNKLWIDNTESATGVQIPTYAELTELSSAITQRIPEPQTEGTSGQVLTTDGNGGRSWTTVQGGGGGVSDVQVNGTSVVTSGVANVPLADTSTFGAVMIGNGLKLNDSNKLVTNRAVPTTIKNGVDGYYPIVSGYIDYATFYGLSKVAGEDLASDTVTLGTYPEKSLSAINQMLNAPVSVSGSTPSITAKSGVRYVCGECSTLSVTAPASGCIDVVFTSGSTATVLTVTSAKSGVTAIKWVGNDDPTALEANKTYEINILDGEFGVIASWT